MQRNNLKMCLRSTDGATDTSEVAKVCNIMKQYPPSSQTHTPILDILS